MYAGYKPPEPESLEPAPDPTRLTAEEGVYAWRLLELTSASRKGANGEKLTMGDLSWLSFLARSRCDLHVACDALAAGCSVKLAVAIFT